MSTIKSSTEHLTLNADGSGKDIKFQANGVEKASISSTGAFTSTSIDATKLSGDLPAIDGSSLTGVGGVTEADSWYLDTQFSVSSNATYTLTNLSRIGTQLGTGMAESSGVFTFPSSGNWLVTFQMDYRNHALEKYWYNYIKMSTDSGSSYSSLMSNATNSLASGSNVYGSNNINKILDITNSSTHRVKFDVFAGNGQSGHYVHAGYGTQMTFIKLGET